MAGMGSLKNISEIPLAEKKLFVCAHDISPEWHVRMQAAFQQFTHNAVSKTVNLPQSAAKEDVRKVYMLAYELGCKGITIYRDHSRDCQVQDTASESVERAALRRPSQQVQPARPKPAQRKKRSRILPGRTIKMETGRGRLYVTLNEDRDGPFEIFNTVGKAGGCAASQSEATGRLVSLGWRSGVPTEEIVKQLSRICCHKQVGLGNDRILSCADAVAKAIRELADPTSRVQNESRGWIWGACPTCGGQLEPEGGCFVCRSCGYSDCS